MLCANSFGNFGVETAWEIEEGHVEECVLSPFMAQKELSNNRPSAVATNKQRASRLSAVLEDRSNGGFVLFDGGELLSILISDNQH